MRLAVMQPYIFPYIGYFQLAHAVDRLFLYDHLDYGRGTWINRNRILEGGRGPLTFSVPVREPRSAKTIREATIDDRRPWRRSLLRSIEQNYRKAPFFEETYRLVEDVIDVPTSSLSTLNKRSITAVCDHLDLSTEILTDSEPFDPMERVLRADGVDFHARYPWLRLDAPQRKVVRALALCRALGADVFVNAIGGRELYDKKVFADHGVELCFVQKRHVPYPQPAPSFVDSLSIIDVLMQCGVESTRRLVAEYDLV